MSGWESHEGGLQGYAKPLQLVMARFFYLRPFIFQVAIFLTPFYNSTLGICWRISVL